MTDNKTGLIDGLVSLTDELKSAQVILYQRTIKRILRYIASNPELKFITTHCSGIYDYSELFANASNGNGVLAFVLPNDNYKVICLVTGLLFNIDRNNIDFLSFIKSNFNGQKVTAQYEDFCEYIMTEYCDAFDMLLNEDSRIVNVDESITEKSAPTRVLDQISPLILDISEQILIDKTMSEGKRVESLAMLEGMCYVLERGNSVLIKAMWIGLKYTISTSKQYASNMKVLRNILSDFGLI